MSTTTTGTRKAPATKVADKPPAKPAAAKKAPAKAAPAKPAAEKRTYTAEARSGQVVRRQFSQPMAWAVDVAEPEGRTARAQAGRIWSFFATKEAAEAWAAKRTAEGYDCVITTAKVVTK